MSWEDIKKEDDLGYYSSTQLEMFRRCPRQYEYRYIKGIKSPPNSALVLGSAVHKGIEHNYRRKFEKKRPAPADEVFDAYDQAFEKGKYGIEFEEAEGQVKDKGYAMSKLHYNDIAPTVQPTQQPEFEFLVDMEGVSKPVKGFIDVIGTTDVGRNVVIDNKTAGKKKTQFETDLSDQLTMYHYAHKVKFGKKPDALALDVMIGNKSGVDKQRLVTRRTDEQIKGFVETVQSIDSSIRAGNFPPTNQSSVCSWCGYNRQCTYAKNAIASREFARV